MLALQYIIQLIETFSIFSIAASLEYYDAVFIPFILVSILFVIFIILSRYYKESYWASIVFTIINLALLLLRLPDFIQGVFYNNGDSLNWKDYEPKQGIYGLIIVIIVIIYQLVKLFLLNKEWIRKALKIGRK
jgi:hypothetical protein